MNFQAFKETNIPKTLKGAACVIIAALTLHIVQRLPDWVDRLMNFILPP